MATWLAYIVVFIAGVAGGVINSLISGEMELPYVDRGSRIYRPGWLGNAVVGGVAAVLLWSLYGPAADFILLGSQAGTDAVGRVTFTSAEIAGNFFTGIGGGRLLTNEVNVRVHQETLRHNRQVSIPRPTEGELAT